MRVVFCGVLLCAFAAGMECAKRFAPERGTMSATAGKTPGEGAGKAADKAAGKAADKARETAHVALEALASGLSSPALAAAPAAPQLEAIRPRRAAPALPKDVEPEPAPDGEAGDDPFDAPAATRPFPMPLATGPLDREGLCALLEAEALARDLPPAFFARLIWQESRFDPEAVSPVGASGIAQFMPATAAEWGLKDPFEPRSAIAASGDFLNRLEVAFGNVGLAAAAYNAGPGRVQRWLRGASGLPAETRHYVRTITGLDAETWRDPATELPDKLTEEVETAQGWCLGLPAIRLQRTASASASDAAPTPASTATPEAAKVRATPWGVQLSATFSRRSAQASLATLKKRHATQLDGRTLAVVRARAPARGRKPLYAVRVAADSRQAANSLCSRVKSAGGDCLVMKN